MQERALNEEDFLKAISSAPDDMMARLVYADWLDEQDDERAEYVRLQVELRAAPYDDADRPRLRLRLNELRKGAEPYWAARLDPPVWCVVGNVVDLRPASQEGPRPRGTRLFRANAKILLATWNNWYAIRDPQRFYWESVEVIGQHRTSRQWIGCWIRMRNTCRWRVQMIHHPGATIRLREAQWPGFLLRPGEFECPAEKRNSPEAAGRLLDAIDAAWRRND